MCKKDGGSKVMKKYIVNTVFTNQEEGKIEKFFYNTYTDYN